MAAVKMDGAKTVEFHAVHRTGKQRDDGKPQAIIACFVNRKTRNELWNRRKELANSSNHQNVVVVPDYVYETSKEQKKLSNALRNDRKKNLTPAYIKNGRLFVQENSYRGDNIPDYLKMKLLQWTSNLYPLHFLINCYPYAIQLGHLLLMITYVQPTYG